MRDPDDSSDRAEQYRHPYVYEFVLRLKSTWERAWTQQMTPTPEQASPCVRRTQNDMYTLTTEGLINW